MPANEAWGLDIGQTAIHAVKVRREGRRGVIDDAFFQDLTTWPDDPEYEDKVLDALQTLVEVKKVGSTPVICGIPGFMTLFREFATTATGNLRNVVGLEARQRIPYPLEDVNWDFHRFGDDGVGEVSVGLVCCRKDIVNGILGILDQARLTVDAMQVAPAALINYIGHDRPAEDGEARVVIDSGARGTDLVIARDDGGFWLRPIGVSGQDLTRALMGKLSIEFEQAEQMKRSLAAGGAQRERAFRILEPVLRALTAEAQRSLGYYRAQNRGVQIRRLTVAGNVYRLGGAAEFIAESMGLPVEPLGPPKSMAVAAEAAEAIGDAWMVSGVAIGLGLQGVGLAGTMTNLLPGDRQLARAIQSKLKYAATAVGVVGATALFSMALTGGIHPATNFKAFVDRASEVDGKVKEQRNGYNAHKAAAAGPEEQARILVARATTRGNMLETFTAVKAMLEAVNDVKTFRSRWINALVDQIEQGQPPFIGTGGARKPSPNAIARMDFDEAMGWYDDWPELAANLKQQWELRTSWLSDRAARVFVDQMELVPGNVVAKDGNQKGWLAEEDLADALRALVGTTTGNDMSEVVGHVLPEVVVSDASSGGMGMGGGRMGMGMMGRRTTATAEAADRKPVPVVAVLLSGRMVLSGFDERDRARLVTEHFKEIGNKIASMPGVLPNSFELKQRLDMPDQLIRVPLITPQAPPPERSATPSATPSAPTAPSAVASGTTASRLAKPGADKTPTLQYVVEEEPVAHWSAVFFFQSKLDRAESAGAAQTAD